VDQPPQDPSQPTPPAPQPPGPAWGRSAAPPAALGPVTLRSTSAGIIVVLLGFGWNAMSASVFVSTAVFGGSIRGNLELVGYVILGIAVVHLLAGIGVLLGKSWGRIIGIISSLLFGAGSLPLALSADHVRFVEAGIRDGIIFGPVFVLYAYSLIVLMARWRRPASA
jgi:hypothetical protein